MKEKQIQISQKLFIMLVKYFVLDMEVDCEEIKKELNTIRNSLASNGMILKNMMFQKK